MAESLGEQASDGEIGESFERAYDMHRTIMEVEMAHNLRLNYERAGDALSKTLRALIERGREVLAVDYASALAGSAPLNAMLDSVFDEYDAILTPASATTSRRHWPSTSITCIS